MRLSDAVRARVREEMTRQNLSQRDLSGLLKWSQSRIAKLLNGRIQFDLDDLEAFSTILNVRPTELVRDRGYEFAAEMTPRELRFLEHFRRLPQPVAESLMTLLRVPESSEGGPKRHSGLPRGRPK